jgi:hypothetical protein
MQGKTMRYQMIASQAMKRQSMPKDGSAFGPGQMCRSAAVIKPADAPLALY